MYFSIGSAIAIKHRKPRRVAPALADKNLYEILILAMTRHGFHKIFNKFIGPRCLRLDVRRKLAVVAVNHWQDFACRDELTAAIAVLVADLGKVFADSCQRAGGNP